MIRVGICLVFIVACSKQTDSKKIALEKAVNIVEQFCNESLAAKDMPISANKPCHFHGIGSLDFKCNTLTNEKSYTLKSYIIDDKQISVQLFKKFPQSVTGNYRLKKLTFDIVGDSPFLSCVSP